MPIERETLQLLRSAPSMVWERAIEDVKRELLRSEMQTAAAHPPGSRERMLAIETACGGVRALDALMGLVRECVGDGR